MLSQGQGEAVQGRKSTTAATEVEGQVVTSSQAKGNERVKTNSGSAPNRSGCGGGGGSGSGSAHETKAKVGVVQKGKAATTADVNSAVNLNVTDADRESQASHVFFECLRYMA